MSFEEHIKSEHNMWHYLYFLVLVRVKDPTEYTGPESYVAQMIVVSRSNMHTAPFVASHKLLYHKKYCSVQWSIFTLYLQQVNDLGI